MAVNEKIKYNIFEMRELLNSLSKTDKFQKIIFIFSEQNYLKNNVYL